MLVRRITDSSRHNIGNYIIYVSVSFSHAVSICTDGHIRLNSTGSTEHNAGRVEICYYGQWESIYDTHWDDRDARVACAQLGFAREGTSISTTYNNIL